MPTRFDRLCSLSWAVLLCALGLAVSGCGEPGLPSATLRGTQTAITAQPGTYEWVVNDVPTVGDTFGIVTAKDPVVIGTGTFTVHISRKFAHLQVGVIDAQDSGAESEAYLAASLRWRLAEGTKSVALVRADDTDSLEVTGLGQGTWLVAIAGEDADGTVQWAAYIQTTD